ncbi:MAG: glycosyltransferase [Solirubrobacterales bacterium]
MTNGERSRLAIYCPDVPPVPGGVSDHTLILARALAERGHPPVVFARRGDPEVFAPLTCISRLAPRAIPAAATRHGVTDLVLQYVPFLFARFGVSPALWRAADALTATGVTLAIVVHEPYVPFTRLPWLLTGWPQRWQLRHLVRRSAFVYAPVPKYAGIVRGYAGRSTHVRTLPIGSTHSVSSATRAEVRRELGIPEDRIVVGVFSPAASGFQPSWLTAAAERLRKRPDVLWLLFGFGSEGAAANLGAADQTMVLGTIEGDRLGRTMRALDLAAQPYTDGLTLRRSGALLALAHGVPLVSSTGHLLDPACTAFAACEESPEAFAARVEQLVTDPAARAVWAARAAGSASISTVGPLADAVVRDLASRLAPRAS